MTPHVAVRADGGSDIGYGHLVRSGALAKRMTVDDCAVTYATTTPEAVRRVCPEGVGTVTLPSRGDPAPFVDWIERKKPDIVFIDAYPVNTSYQRAVSKRVPLGVWQDTARHAICADLFVNGNLYAPELDYEFVGSEPQAYLGTNYLLLRDSIRELTRETPPWRETPVRAIITMGGSDTANLTPTVLEAFDGFDLRIDAIVGPGFTGAQEDLVRETAADILADVRTVRDPKDLPERMHKADFAVSTASTTTYELLALGTPIVSCPVVDNQKPIADALRDRNLASIIERDSDRPNFRRAIERYLKETPLRKRRRDRGRAVVDGWGSNRICTELLSLGSRNDRT